MNGMNFPGLTAATRAAMSFWFRSSSQPAFQSVMGCSSPPGRGAIPKTSALSTGSMAAEYSLSDPASLTASADEQVCGDVFGRHVMFVRRVV